MKFDIGGPSAGRLWSQMTVASVFTFPINIPVGNVSAVNGIYLTKMLNHVGSRERRKKMKLTLEQKVFIEYGKARKALEIAKKQLAKEMRRYSSRHQARDYNNIDILIRDVWRKRAAYRTWVRVPMNERFCDNCAHEGTHPDSTPCSECFRFSFPQAYEEFDNWEPRKENEN